MKEMVLCEKVSKKLGSYQLKDICFALPKGYVLGVIGRNGTGKTTLLRCLMGIYRLEGNALGLGEVSIDGIAISKDAKAYKKQYILVSSASAYPNSYRAKEVGELFGCYYEGFTMERFLKNMERFEVPKKAMIQTLSKGQLVRLQLAFALSVDVKVYIFDEPTGNLDVEFREEFYRLVRELMADGEKTVIYASHLVEELEGLADYILWLHNSDESGEQKFFGTLEELKETYRMLEGTKEVLGEVDSSAIIGGRERENHGEWLVLSEALSEQQRRDARYADLKEIMYYEEKGLVH